MHRPTAAPLTSAFGWRRLNNRDDFHSGNDYATPYGSPVDASASGTVIAVGPINRYGLAVVVRHEATPAPLFTLYGHLSAALVTKGQIVQEGETIAESGDSAGSREDPNARTTRPHLHHELLTQWPPRGVDLDRIDPQPYITSAPAPTPRRSAIARSTTAGGGALLMLLAAYWYTTKRKRRSVTKRPALDPPTQPGNRWLQ